MLPSGICQVLPASQRAAELYWRAGTVGFSSRSLVPVGYSAVKWLVWSVFTHTVTISLPFLHPAQEHIETSTLYLWYTAYIVSPWGANQISQLTRNISHWPNNNILWVTTLCFIFRIYRFIYWFHVQGLVRLIELTLGLEVFYRLLNWPLIRTTKFFRDIRMVSFTTPSRTCWPLCVGFCSISEQKEGHQSDQSSLYLIVSWIVCVMLFLPCWLTAAELLSWGNEGLSNGSK